MIYITLFIQISCPEIQHKSGDVEGGIERKTTIQIARLRTFNKLNKTFRNI